MHTLNRQRILVVDDDRAVRALLRGVLEAGGAIVVEACDGAQALRLLELDPHTYDVVICDLDMPRMDGTDLIVAIRARWGWSVGIAVCSALTHVQWTHGVNNVVDASIAKPFTPRQLVDTITGVIRNLPASRPACDTRRSLAAG